MRGSSVANRSGDDQRLLTAIEIEQAFIDQHWKYGLLIHEKSAEALYAALGEPSEPETGHPIFARLYGEYAGTAETLAALAIAIRERTEPGSLLHRYVTYPLGDVPAFYARVQEHEGDLSDLLALPDMNVLIALAAARQDDMGRDIEKYAITLDELRGRFTEVAEMYLKDDRLQVLVYNRTKHGSPMLRIFEPEDTRKFEIVCPNPEAKRDGESLYMFASFPVTRAEADKWLENTRAMTASMRELAVIVKLLKDSDLLYPPP